MIDRRKNTEFGILLALILTVITAWNKTDLTVPVIIVLLIALVIPKLYTPLTWFWFKLGEWLGIVVSRCVLFILFFLIVTPVGYIRRLAGKDTFRLKQFAKGSGSVFVCEEKAYQPTDLEQQY